MPAIARDLPEPLAEVARAWALGGHVDDAAAVAEELSTEYWGFASNQRSFSAAIHNVAHRHGIPPIPADVDAGPQLFEAVVASARSHYYFDSEWHYVLVALFILQARIVQSLPAVFYLFFGGRYGTGKTNILRLIADMTDGVLLENVSVAALARMITSGKVVCMDEFDVPRGKDLDEVRDALVRQGYKASAAPYMRWNAASRELEPVPIYGPKALAFRGVIEDALQSRGFTIPTASPVGEGGYDLVLRNLFPELKDIAVRVSSWGARAVVEFPPDRVREIAMSPTFRAKVRAVVQELGANRDSELMTVALLTAEIAGVDVLATLKLASEHRESSAADTADDALGELAAVVGDLARSSPRALGEVDGITRLKQSSIAEELNRRRRESGKYGLGTQRLAKCRRELGVKDEWLRASHKASWWHLPREFLTGLEPSVAAPSTTGATPPGSPTSPVRQDEKGDWGNSGNRLSPTRGPPPLPSKHDPGDLFGERPTRADLARSRAGSR
ncbi:MAG: hypothetical protein L3K05_05470 [Thermoplasmata archaeon]|nr:hypothetical protein [Thermoplasmata archaeon]